MGWTEKNGGLLDGMDGLPYFPPPTQVGEGDQVMDDHTNLRTAGVLC